MKNLEKFLYEARPYFFMLIAFITLCFSKDNTLRLISGGTLFLTALVVINARIQYRRVK